MEYDADCRKKVIRGCRKRLELDDDEFPELDTGMDEDSCIAVPRSLIKAGSKGVEIGSEQKPFGLGCCLKEACILM